MREGQVSQVRGICRYCMTDITEMNLSAPRHQCPERIEAMRKDLEEMPQLTERQQWAFIYAKYNEPEFPEELRLKP